MIIHLILIIIEATKCLTSVNPGFLFLSFPADRDHFQLGSLSHLLNAKAGGYQELPDWPEAAPDPSVRNVEVKDSVRAVGTVTYRDTRGGPLGVLQGASGKGGRGAWVAPALRRCLRGG